MTFLNDLESDRDNVFLNEDEFAESITYRAAGSTTSQTITAVLFDSADTSTQRVRNYWISAADVASPALMDEITVGSEIWSITGTEAEQLGMHLITVERRQDRA